MSIDERIALARLAYIRAVAMARRRPSPANWARLLTAAKNLHAAVGARQRRADLHGEPRSP